MRKALSIAITSLIFAEAPLLAAETGDYLNFYKEEAMVVSASLRPQSAQQTPATVYVVTQKDIKDSGALNLWDALRSVPGVDVMSTRTGQGEISIRGLNRPFNNRVLILVDGRSVANAYFDNLTWNSLQVQRDEIDRIEVVEGPASAVYGADATAGVINIITRTPEQMQGGKVSYTGGERSTQEGSIVYGKKQGQLAYKLGGGWRSTNRFENAAALASEAGEFNSLVSYDFSDHSGMSISGGVNNYNTQTSIGILGALIDKGQVSYGRADYHFRGFRARTSLDYGNIVPGSGNLTYNRIDTQVDQSLTLPFHNQAAFGASYRRNTARDQVLGNGSVSQDLWAAFFEDKWEMTEKWMLMGSGRVDRHPLTPIRFSPRGSLLYTPAPEHVFRVSAGTSFRNPTLTENYLNSAATTLIPPPGIPPFPYPLYNSVQNTAIGNPQLSPETMKSVEISHTGRFQRVKTNITGFYYHFRDTIDLGTPTLNLSGGIPPPPSIPVTTSFVNNPDPLHAWGGELSAEYFATAWLSLFGNYSYQSIRTDSGFYYPAAQYPRHKANAGIKTNSGGWTTNWIVHWVDSTVWPITNAGGSPSAPVSAYFLVDAHMGYAFAGRLNGLELGVNAFNLLNHDHYETLPSSSAGAGQSAEIIKSRFTGTVSYKF